MEREAVADFAVFLPLEDVTELLCLGQGAVGVMCALMMSMFKSVIARPNCVTPLSWCSLRFTRKIVALSL